MNITYYPFDPIEVQQNNLNVIDIGVPNIFADFIASFLGVSDNLKVSNNKLEIMGIGQAFLYIGDLFESDLNRIFQKYVKNTILSSISDSEVVNLLDTGRQLVEKTVEATFALDLPLLGKDIDLNKVLKFADIHLDESFIAKPCGKIETLVKLMSELEMKKIPVVANASHYLIPSEIDEVSELVTQIDSSILFIEFSEISRFDRFKNVKYTFIDQDFTLWS